MTLRLVLVFVGSLAAGSAAAEEDWETLARRVDVADPAAVREARLLAEARAPSFWSVPHPRGGLLAAMARDVPAQDLPRMLREREGDPETFGVLLRNLAARDDLAAALLDRGDLPERLPAAALQPAIDVALDAAVHGDARLALRLLGVPRFTREVGERLADAEHASEVALLAEAVVGAHPLPREVRASLADVVPDLHNRYMQRSLGGVRIRALHAVASTDSDPGLRVLAARILHASLDPAVMPVLLAAYDGARSWRIERDEWQLLGKHYGLPPGVESLSEAQRHDLLYGYLVRDHVRATSDPEGAAHLALEVRDLWRRLRTPQARGHLLRFLDVWNYVFIDASRARPWAAPAWLELLTEWETQPAGADPGLAALVRGVVARARHRLQVPEGHPPPPGRGERLVRSASALSLATRAYRALREPSASASTGGLAEATRLLAGLDADPEARASLADAEEYGPSVRLDVGEREGVRVRFALDATVRARLGRLLAEEPDPWLVDWCANRLALAGGAAEVALLVEHAQRLAITDVRSSHPLTDLNGLAGEADVVDVLLSFVASPVAAPGPAIEVYERLSSDLLDADEEWEAAPRAARIARLLAWTAQQVPLLHPDRAEGVLLALLRVQLAGDDPRRARLLDLVKEALVHLASPGVASRVTRALEAAGEER